MYVYMKETSMKYLCHRLLLLFLCLLFKATWNERVEHESPF